MKPSLFEQIDRPDMHDIIIQTEREPKSPVFDPGREVPQLVWQHLIDRWHNPDRQWANNKWAGGHPIALAIGLVRPDLVAGLPLGEHEQSQLKEMIPSGTGRKFRDLQNRMAHLTHLKLSEKVLFPNTFSVDEAFISLALAFYQESYAHTMLHSQISTAVDLKLLAPSRVNELSKSTRDQDYLELNIDYLRDEKSWYTFIWASSSYKILFPDKEDNLQFDAKTWESLREFHDQMAQFGENSSYRENEYAQMLIQLAILAGDIDATDSEIRIISPTEKMMATPATVLPEVLKLPIRD